MCFPITFVQGRDDFMPSFINFCGNSAVLAAGVAVLTAVTSCALEALGYVAAATSVAVILPAATTIVVYATVIGLASVIAYFGCRALVGRPVNVN
ncbi:MAG: hypothetical protein H0T62_12650 [Parachlamydiaceae bacterium]|nr:hypothetical protein [Parachlamydiaceae bacterium]